MIENKFYFRDFFLNVAHYVVGTRVLGPGYRSVIWLQGCPFHCVGCISPEWIIKRENQLINLNELVRIVNLDQVEGITISGGEPLLQAKNLIRFLILVKTIKPEANIIVFSGFRIDEARKYLGASLFYQLFRMVDVFIDGRYEEKENDGRGLRGSRNQKIWHLSDRLVDFPFEFTIRSQEFHFQKGSLTMVGIPNPGQSSLIDTIRRNYVRP